MVKVFLEYDKAKDNYKIVVFVGSEMMVLDGDDVRVPAGELYNSGYTLYAKHVATPFLSNDSTPLEEVGTSYTVDSLVERVIFREV